ncbi:MAG: FAD-dependent oxidoreductase [Hyphomonadaceae bacterium]
MPLSDSDTLLVIGGGQAAAQTIASARLWGFAGEIRLIGEESALPYQRPPLSKAYLKGEMDEERLYFKPAEWYADQNVETRLGLRAEVIDREARSVSLSDGSAVSYDALVLATGSRPRPLPLDGATLEGVHELRDLRDVDGLKPVVTAGKDMVIVGAGYIGLEAAAVARQLGANVTVLEMADRVLARVTSPVMSEFYTKLHETNGVRIMTGAALTALHGEDGRIKSAELADGTRLNADVVLIGIGILPNSELAEAAGLECDRGILVDEDARTSDRRIFAAGDCTVRPLVHYGRKGRLESVHNAIEQGKLAAAAITGRDRPKLDVPWFWSDQYDAKLQIAGLSEHYDEHIVRGDPESGSFSVFYFRSGKLIAVDAVNAAPEFIVTKKLIISGASLAPAELQDTSLSMKDLAARAAN